jgi:hypothetical protein
MNEKIAKNWTPQVWADWHTNSFAARDPSHYHALARRLAAAIFHLRAHAGLYTTRETNLMGATIYVLHLDASRYDWNLIWGAVGGFEHWAGKKGVLTEAQTEQALRGAA